MARSQLKVTEIQESQRKSLSQVHLNAHHSRLSGLEHGGIGQIASRFGCCKCDCDQLYISDRVLFALATTTQRYRLDPTGSVLGRVRTHKKCVSSLLAMRQRHRHGRTSPTYVVQSFGEQLDKLIDMVWLKFCTYNNTLHAFYFWSMRQSSSHG